MARDDKLVAANKRLLAEILYLAQSVLRWIMLSSCPVTHTHTHTQRDRERERERERDLESVVYHTHTLPNSFTFIKVTIIQ